MRWNWVERSVGEGVAAAVLVIAGVVSTQEVTADRVRPGMTPAEVAATLGTPGRPHTSKFAFQSAPFWIPRDDEDRQRLADTQRDYLRRYSTFYREYLFPFGAVDVYFSGVPGEEVVHRVEHREVITWGRALVVWACAACVLGFLAAEVARRRLRPPAT